MIIMATKKKTKKTKKKGRPKGTKTRKTRKTRKTAVTKKKRTKKGSSSQLSQSAPASPKRKRGRPKGSGKKSKKSYTESKKYSNLPDDYKPPKSHKMLGYCSRKGCTCMIGTLDLVSKLIFVCPVCSKRDHIKKLKKPSKPKEQMSKKEFLDSHMTTDYHDMPAMNDPEINIQPDGL